IRKLDGAAMPPYQGDIVPPLVTEEGIRPNGDKALVVAKPVAAEHFKLINKQPLRRKPPGPEFALALQDWQSGVYGKPSSFLLGAANDIGLKRRKVMPQPCEAGRKQAGML